VGQYSAAPPNKESTAAVVIVGGITLCAFFSVHSWISGNGMKYLGKIIGLVTSFLFEQHPTALYEAAW
jgi:hypothetical protein